MQTFIYLLLIYSVSVLIVATVMKTTKEKMGDHPLLEVVPPITFKFMIFVPGINTVFAFFCIVLFVYGFITRKKIK